MHGQDYTLPLRYVAGAFKYAVLSRNEGAVFEPGYEGGRGFAFGSGPATAVGIDE
jgi:hypothetical protein